jgi:hypothetical protein
MELERLKEIETKYNAIIADKIKEDEEKKKREKEEKRRQERMEMVSMLTLALQNSTGVSNRAKKSVKDEFESDIEEKTAKRRRKSPPKRNTDESSDDETCSFVESESIKNASLEIKISEILARYKGKKNWRSKLKEEMQAANAIYDPKGSLEDNVRVLATTLLEEL